MTTVGSSKDRIIIPDQAQRRSNLDEAEVHGPGLADPEHVRCTRTSAGLCARGFSAAANDELTVYSGGRTDREEEEEAPKEKAAESRNERKKQERREEREAGEDGRAEKGKAEGEEESTWVEERGRPGIGRDRGPFVRLDVGPYSLYRESNKWPQPSSSDVVSSSTFRHGNSFPSPRCD